ncbi:MAG TPA: hypothetical protein VKQ06_06575 [Gammaproteobacteria bacterium]|nr:hypothetical protein [Gammaproteobacteria bacterium]
MTAPGQLLRGAPALAVIGAWLCGCSSAVVVDSSFPTPLVEPLPARVGLFFSDELYDYIHSEALPQQSTWTIDLGDANVAMLEPLLRTMFVETRTLDTLPLSAADRADLDGVIVPVLEKFEFDIPFGERDEFVEVWMQYQIGLYRTDGQVVLEWPVSGYGKFETGGKRVEAVEQAAIFAMREVGATISTKFAEQPDVGYWLEEVQDATGNANVAIVR